jgi:hypothetical protein
VHHASRFGDMFLSTAKIIFDTHRKLTLVDEPSGIERELARQMDLKTSAKLSQSVKSLHPRKPR